MLDSTAPRSTTRAGVSNSSDGVPIGLKTGRSIWRSSGTRSKCSALSDAQRLAHAVGAVQDQPYSPPGSRSAMMGNEFGCQEAPVETARVEPTDLILLEGEQVAAALETRGGSGPLSPGGHEALILTDSRIIHSSTGGRRRGAVVVAVGDIDSVEVTTVRPGIGAYFLGCASGRTEPGSLPQHRRRHLEGSCCARRAGDGCLSRGQPNTGLGGADGCLQDGWVRDQVAVRRQEGQ